MKIGIIAPIVALDKYCSLSNLQYCYANLLFLSKKYFNFYKNRVLLGDTVVLDSDPEFPRKAYNPELLYRAALELRPTAVVLPSCDFSVDRTLSWVSAFVSKFGDLDCRYIGVVQGADKKSVRRCYKSLLPLSDWVGLPNTLEKIESRDKLVTQLKIDRPIIYLETYSNPVEEFPKNKKVDYVVSSFPLRLSYELRKLSEPIPSPRPLDFNSKELPMEEVTERNIKQFLGMESK